MDQSKPDPVQPAGPENQSDEGDITLAELLRAYRSNFDERGHRVDRPEDNG